MIKCSKIFFLSFLLYGFLFAQSNLLQSNLTVIKAKNKYSVENLTVTDGLYENNIQDILQDRYGFMWFAGMAGLQKYDGYTFTYYKPDSINPSWQDAERLFEDSAGNLWVQMKEGLVRYQRELDTFVKYYFVKDKKDTIPYTVTAITEDLNGNVLFWIYGNGLFKIDNSRNSFIPYLEVNELYEYDLNSLVRCLVFDLENNLWIGMNSQGLLMINPQKCITKKYLPYPNVPGSLSNKTVTASLRDPNGDLWFATKRGLNRFDPENDSFENFFIDASDRQNKVNAFDYMADDGHGNIWVTGSDEYVGLGFFNKRIKKFIHLSEGISNTAGFSSVTADRSGNIWIGKWYSGIYKIDPDGKKFSAFTIKKGDRDLLIDKGPQAVLKDQGGDVWIGGNMMGGLYRYNLQNGNYRIYKLNRSTTDKFESNWITEIFQDSKDILWIGTRSGLMRFDRRTERFKHFLSASSIRWIVSRPQTILEDATGILWLVTINGFLVQFNPKSEEMEYFSIPGKQISFRAAVMDPKGFIWIGTFQNGLVKFDTTSKKLLSVEKVSNRYMSALCMDGDSILWVTTNGDGLIRYNTKSGIKTIINETDGLLSNGLVGMGQDNSGNLWLGSHRGLIRYSPRTHTFKNYFKEDGFLTNEFIYRGTFKDRNGGMVFGSLHGIVTFHPDSVRDSDYRPPLVLTGIKIDNKLLKPGKDSPLKKNISISDEIILNYDQNDLSITFASLDFSHPERNEYAFYLQGLEDNWRPSGSEHTAYYTNLDPGEYVFKVKGTNSDGVWNEAGTSLKIIILPPWWASWWSYTIYICVFLGLLLFIRGYELNRQNLKHSWELERVETEKYQEIDRMKSRFFANISHEFRTPLTLIKGPIQQMLSGDFKGSIEKQYKMILRNTNRLMQLINQLLDLSKLDSGEMVLRTSPEDIVPLVTGLTQSFESLAKQKNIELQFQSFKDKIIVYIDRDRFEKIIINLLSNALKFTPEGGVVSVNINVPTIGSSDKSQTKKDPLTFVEIFVKNTGPGILPKQIDKIFDRFYQVDDSSVRKYEGTGIGLALTKELVELHHGKIKVESELEKETTFRVYLPLGKNHLQPEEVKETPTKVLSDIKIDSDLIESSLASKSKTETLIHQPAKDSSTLLIVEDNADMRSYMSENLESNYKIIEAENGEEGIQQSLKYSPDIIISDVMMPKMDGFQFCSEIKKDERTSHIPVILLTAKASGESKIKGLETGADDYLTKPFDTRELKVRINNLIEQRRKLQEKFRKEITVGPRDITVTSIDEQLVQKAIDVVEKNISNPNFDTTKMAKEVGISRMLLNTKLKALTGLPTGEFIRTIRLKRAAQLLQQGYGNVTDIAYEVGFQSLSYFAKAFREQFGKSPSQYSHRV